MYHWGCTLIYWPLSYPFSLKQTNLCHLLPGIFYRELNLIQFNYFRKKTKVIAFFLLNYDELNECVLVLIFNVVPIFRVQGLVNSK